MSDSSHYVEEQINSISINTSPEVMSQICRLCGVGVKTTPLDQTLCDKIRHCLRMTVDVGDRMPQQICQYCVLHLNGYYSFLLMCRETDAKLRTLQHQLLDKNTNKNQNLISSPVYLNTPLHNESSELSADKLNVNSHDNVIPTLQSTGKSSPIPKCIETEQEQQFFCPKCEMVFVTQTEMETHLKKVCSMKKEFQCQYCYKQYTTSNSLSIHESTHSSENAYLCDLCGKAFKHPSNLKSHKRTHSDVKKKFSCKICQKQFSTRYLLKEHNNTHSGLTPYCCNVCGKQFRESVHLRQHKWTHSGNKFICSICGTQFNRKGNMTEHMKKHLSNKISSKRKYLEKVKLEEHNAEVDANSEILIRDKKYCCKICGKKFSYSGSLTYHRRTEHTGERPFKCSFCDETFPLKSIQSIHERKKHTFNCPYQCQYCDKSFISASACKNHSYVHIQSKIFHCGVCGRQFSRKGALSVHQKIHLGIKQFECEFCKKRFIQKNDMVKHKKSHEAQSKPLFCRFCGNHFAKKKDKAKHAHCQYILLRKRELAQDATFDEKCRKLLFDRITDDETEIAQSVEIFYGRPSTFDEFTQKEMNATEPQGEKKSPIISEPIVLQN